MTIIDYFKMHQFASDTIHMYNNLFTFIIGGQQGTFLSFLFYLITIRDRQSTK